MPIQKDGDEISFVNVCFDDVDLETSGPVRRHTAVPRAVPEASNGDLSSMSYQLLQSAPAEGRDELVTGAVQVEEVDDSQAQEECGYGRLKPRFLQRYATPKSALVCLCGYAFLQGFLISGITSVNMSTLERRYELSSTEVSLIPAAYDIAGAVVSIPLTYYAATGHQPRMISVSALLMAVGAGIMVIPHFASGVYTLGDALSDECVLVGSSNATVCSADSSTSRPLAGYLWVFILGQVLQSVSGIAIYSVGSVYLDTNLSDEDSAYYNGILQGVAALGPATGFLLGGTLLQTLYIDFNVPEAAATAVTPSDPRWAGAWWPAYLLAAGFLLISAASLWLFPRQLHARRKLTKRISQTHQDSNQNTPPATHTGILSALRSLLTNSVYMLVTLTAILDAVLVSGYAAFLPKLIQDLYGQTAGIAAVVAGVVVVPGAAGGHFVGGLICRKFALRVRGMLWLSFGAIAISLVLSFVILDFCDPAATAGIQIPYYPLPVPNEPHGSNTTELLTLPHYTNSPLSHPALYGNLSLSSECNSHCHCSTRSYEPVCGADGMQYFSPCHAGCATDITFSNSTKLFTNCSCVSGGGTTSASPCPIPCPDLYIFFTFFLLAMFLTFIPTVPRFMVTMRSVGDSQRSLALGLQSLLGRLLGACPGPILVGAIFDAACLLWQEDDCGARGSCWVYRQADIAYHNLYLILILKAMTLATLFACVWVYRPPPSRLTDPQGGGEEGVEGDSLSAKVANTKARF